MRLSAWFGSLSKQMGRLLFGSERTLIEVANQMDQFPFELWAQK